MAGDVTLLPCKVGIIVPTKDRRGRRLPLRTLRVLRRTVQTWFQVRFRGGSIRTLIAVRQRLRGFYLRNDDVLAVSVIREPVEEVFSQCTRRDFAGARREILTLAKKVARMANQEEVAVWLNQTMVLVKR